MHHSSGAGSELPLGDQIRRELRDAVGSGRLARARGGITAVRAGIVVVVLQDDGPARAAGVEGGGHVPAEVERAQEPAGGVEAEEMASRVVVACVSAVEHGAVGSDHGRGRGEVAHLAGGRGVRGGVDAVPGAGATAARSPVRRQPRAAATVAEVVAKRGRPARGEVGVEGDDPAVAGVQVGAPHRDHDAVRTDRRSDVDAGPQRAARGRRRAGVGRRRPRQLRDRERELAGRLGAGHGGSERRVGHGFGAIVRGDSHEPGAERVPAPGIGEIHGERVIEDGAVRGDGERPHDERAGGGAERVDAGDLAAGAGVHPEEPSARGGNVEGSPGERGMEDGLPRQAGDGMPVGVERPELLDARAVDTEPFLAPRRRGEAPRLERHEEVVPREEGDLVVDEHAPRARGEVGSEGVVDAVEEDAGERQGDDRRPAAVGGVPCPLRPIGRSQVAAVARGGRRRAAREQREAEKDAGALRPRPRRPTRPHTLSPWPG